MNYFIIPGRVPALSTLELTTILENEYPAASLESVGGEALTIVGSVDIPKLVHRLGGAVKGGTLFLMNKKDWATVAEALSTDLLQRSRGLEGRLTFGISVYSVSQKPLKGNEARRTALWIQKTGLTLKKELRERGVSARFVSPPRGDHALSSVVVEKNHLTQKPSVEYVLLIGDEHVAISATEAVQDFEAYSYRDYNRPHRDMKIGLLPPKLARAMVNLAGVKKNATILDPFCGLGTILQEALLLGCTHASGSDIDEKNVGATKENLEWLKEKYNSGSAAVKQCDARNLESFFKKNSIDAIVTEPTLGPTLNIHRPSVSKKEIAELCDLYIDSFRSFRDVLKPGGRVVIVFPVWIENGKQTRIPCVEDIERIGFINITTSNSLDPGLHRDDGRRSFVVAREDSRVARELFIFAQN